MQRERPGYVEAVLAEVADRGPIAASELTDPGAKQGPWWGWAYGKAVLEWLFYAGRVGSAGRGGTSNAATTSPSGCCPRRCSALPTPSIEDAHRALVLESARWLGIGTARDIADYFRIMVTAARPVSPSSSRPAGCTRYGSRDGSNPRICMRTPSRRVACRSAGFAVALRLARLGAEPDRASLRHALQDRAVHPRREARARLLRAAVPARRRTGGASRPEVRSQELDLAHARPASRTSCRLRRGRRSSPPSSTPSSARWPPGSGSNT